MPPCTTPQPVEELLRESDRDTVLWADSAYVSPAIANASNRTKRKAAISELLRCIGTDPIPVRPNRSEPRAVKRRPKGYQYLTAPRKQMVVASSRRLK